LCQTVSLEKLLAESLILLGPHTERIIDENGLSVAGCFTQAYVPGDVGVIEKRTKVVGDFLFYLGGEPCARVIHGEEKSLDGEVGVGDLLDAFDGVDEAAEPLESEVFALEGDENGMGGHEGVDGEYAQGRWTIKEDEGGRSGKGSEGVFESIDPVGLLGEL